MVKIFVSGVCCECTAAKQLHQKLNHMGIQTELYYTETAEGLAESVFYGINQIPSLIFEDKNGDIRGWRGCLPDSASDVIECLF